MFESLLFDKQEVEPRPGGCIAWITLNRPEKLNAVNLQMRDEMWTAMEWVRSDPDVGAIVLRGAGERAFSAGADITEFGTAPSYVEARRARHERDLWGLMLAIEKPMIASIRGFALGAGCEMSLCCDLRIASEDASFGLPEVKLGYIPSAGGTQLLPRTIARGNALLMILTGEPISARQALDFGLVQWVVPAGDLQARTEELARRVVARPAPAVRRAKEAVVRGLDLPLEEGVRMEWRLGRALEAVT
ncbi:MAG TPA: enoyl-CoA hydratase/isomerase family protein [Dehalococcoidia bacterium]|nr:enoyl-CoA hydratase/isomerase family protein [Dehalococcoidia bacterium]